MPRHAAMKNLPHKWMTMKKKKSSTLHRWNEFTRCPAVEVRVGQSLRLRV